jgi:hypothetical protein
VLVAATASTAGAAARAVTLLGVGGPTGSDLADNLEQSLAELYDFVPGEVYRSASRRLKAPGASPEEIQVVAAQLRIDAIVAGVVSGPRGAHVLQLVVRDGGTGEPTAKLRYELGNRPAKALQERVLSDLVRAFELVHGVGPRRPRVAQPNEVEPGEEPTEEPKEEPNPEPIVKRTGRVPSAVARAFEIGIGLSLLTRQLGFDAAAPGYSGGTLAGVRVDGAVYPFALNAEFSWEHPALAAFGLVGSYERALHLVSSDASVSTPGRAERWHLLLVGKIPLGRIKNRNRGDLTLETGYASIAFAHADAHDLAIPDVGYDLLDAGLSLDQPLGTRLVSLNLRFAFLGVLGTGAIGSDTEYGTNVGWGLDAEAGLTLWPIRWLWVKLGARYSRVALSFAGSGARFARNSADQWASGVLEVGGAL